jgi:ferredoxin/flavodoxin---NADP+ reductase
MIEQSFSRHQVIAMNQVSPTMALLRVERKNKNFQPGQHIPLRLTGDSSIRDFSIYSAVQETHFNFLIRRIPFDPFTNRLWELRTGDDIELGDAVGVMTIEVESIGSVEIWFIATGIGIAPFHSIIISYPEINYRLIHGIQTLNDAFDSADYAIRRYIRCVSRGPGGEHDGRLTSFLKDQVLPEHALYYISGNSEMVFETSQLLIQRGVKRSEIRSDQL